jgi:hypothetical protein
MLHPKLTRAPLKQLAALFLVLCWCSASSAQTTTNILDTFNRNGALDSSAPDIADVNAPGNWTVPAGSAAFNTTNANGGALRISGQGYSWLNFAPQDGYVYTLSVIQTTSSSGSGDRWAAVGFDNGTQTQPYLAHGPWVLVKATGSFESYYNGVGNPIASGTVNAAGTSNLLQIILDTTISGSWKGQIKINGVNRGSAVTLPGWSVSSIMISSWGTLSETNTQLTVTSIQPTAPSISSQPNGITNWAGATALLAVAAAGSQPLSYQWYKGNISNPLSGQTSDTLAFSPLAGTDSGSYFAIITNTFGSVTSSVVNVHAETSTVLSLTPSISVLALPAVDTDAASGLNGANTYLSALDFGTGTGPTTVNSVVFEKIDPTGLAVTNGVDSTYGGNWELSKTTIFGPTLTGMPGDATGQAEGSMLTLLNDAVTLGGGDTVLNDTISLNLGGVVPTGQYSLRIYFRSLADGNPLIANVAFNGQGSDEVVQLDENIGTTANSSGAYCVRYNFTAVTNSVTVKFSQAAPMRPAYVYAAALQQISAPLVAPIFNVQPQGFTNWVGSAGALNASATGTAPIRYQWYRGSLPLAGETNTSLNFPNLAGTNTGAYSVVATNLAGAATSSVANVFVVTSGVWTYTPTLSVVQIPVTGSDAASGIDATNTYLAALDFGDDTTELVINGVNFTQVSVAGNGTGTVNLPEFTGVDTSYGGSWSLTASNTAGNAAGFAGLAADAVGNVGSQADGNLQLMLTDITYVFGAMPPGNFGRLALGGLTPGAKYSLRYYYRRWSSNRPISFTFDGHGTNETVQVDLDAGGANYLNYDFTAAGTSVALTLAVNVTEQGPHFYGVTLQQTAPGSAPQLHIARSASQVTIWWDAAYSGFTLQFTTNLTNPNWSAVPGVTTNGITLSNPAGNTFFRLRN